MWQSAQWEEDLFILIIEHVRGILWEERSWQPPFFSLAPTVNAEPPAGGGTTWALVT